MSETGGHAGKKLVRNQKWNELNYCSFKKESFLCILVSFGVSIILIVIYLMKPISIINSEVINDVD